MLDSVDWSITRTQRQQNRATHRKFCLLWPRLRVIKSLKDPEPEPHERLQWTTAGARNLPIREEQVGTVMYRTIYVNSFDQRSISIVLCHAVGVRLSQSTLTVKTRTIQCDISSSITVKNPRCRLLARFQRYKSRIVCRRTWQLLIQPQNAGGIHHEAPFGNKLCPTTRTV